MTFPSWLRLLLVIGLGLAPLLGHAQEVPPREVQLEFFEKKIRPLLADHCYPCHSTKSKSLKAGLRLDHLAALLKGGDSGPAVVPGKPDESLLIAAVRYESYEMPPSGKLQEVEIAALAQWVAWGAPWPTGAQAPRETPTSGYDWQRARQHWAFQPIQRPPTPPWPVGARIHNPIDAFVAQRLHARGIRQPAPAAASVFVRRAFLDLIGIPPSPEQLQQWVARLDQGPDQPLVEEAVSQLVRQLLDRPQYGERWGRHWLDVARYSDVGGWSQDNRNRPHAWRYRDWVVARLNSDMPFDAFVRHQIAGDLLQGSQGAVATGFFALGPSYSSDGGDPESIAQAKGETLDDRVDTFSRAFLALTVSCARCHDHKFDPIPTLDYYSLAGIFENSGERDYPLAPEEVVRAFHDHEQRVKETSDAIKQLQKTAKEEKRELSAAELTQRNALKQRLERLQAAAPARYDEAHGIHDRGSADMQVALRGNLLKPGQVAPRRFLEIVSGSERAHFQEGSGRAQLAEAVTDPNNPLTARVIVNRVWLHHFGSALVRTPSNFGMLGESPTHPALLDYLAVELRESGWSLKELHHLIMTSATYRGSSRFREQPFALDGDNRLLWRMNPRRMDVETWRDALLFVTGELDLALGGRAVDDIVASRRRTLYAKVSRNAPYASDRFLRLFDFPIPRATSAGRNTSVIPQQFLFMMNSPFMVDRAKALASRLSSAPRKVDAIEQVYRIVYGRHPTRAERRSGEEFLVLSKQNAGVLDPLTLYCQVLLSSNEFMYVR